MGLKDKLLKIAGSETVKQIISPENIEATINGLTSKISKSMGQPSTNVRLEKNQSNCLVIKFKMFSLKEISSLVTGNSSVQAEKGRYYIFDTNGILKYQTNDENSFFLDKDTYHLFDMDNNELGTIKESVFSVGVPLLEKDVKKCSVFLSNEKLCVLKGYKSFGEKNIEILDSNYCVEYNKSEKHIMIKSNGKKIAKLHILPHHINNGFIDKFVLEYDNSDLEIVAILLSVAISFVL